MAEELTNPSITTEATRPPEIIGIQLIKDGIVKQNPDYDRNDQKSKIYVINFDKAKKKLESIQVNTVPSVVIFGEEQIKLQGGKSFKKVVKAFVDHGDIPSLLAYQIGRIVRPSDILVHNESFARFLLEDGVFPETAGYRADLEIGTEYVNGWAFDDMKKATVDAGLTLTNEQIFYLVLRNGISHEYGHAIESVIILLKQAELKEADESVGERSAIWNKKLHVPKEVEDSIYTTIAPQEELKQLLANQPEEGNAVERSQTSQERIATGYESLGTRYALEELGVDNGIIEKVMNNLYQADQSRFNDTKSLMNLLSENGLNMQDFADARSDIYKYLKDQGEQKLYGPLRWGLDTRYLGYFFPLTRGELQKFLLFQLKDIKLK